MSHLDCWYYVAYEYQYIMSSLEKRLATIICDRFSDSESDSDSESSIGSSFPSAAPTPLARHSTGMFPSLFRSRNEPPHKYSREPPPIPKLARKDTPRNDLRFSSSCASLPLGAEFGDTQAYLRNPTSLFATQRESGLSSYSYDKVMFEVRNMQVLSPQQMMYLRTLPKDKILELLDIYNQIMVNVNEVFS